MIAQGMQIQIRRCGTTIPVERLVIGDVVYDPFTDNYLEIVDILSRSSASVSHQLTRLRKGVLGKDVPAQDLVVSRHQAVAYLQKAHDGKRLCMDVTAAHRLGEAIHYPTKLFALFPESTGFARVAGSVLKLTEVGELLSAASRERA